MKKSANLQDRFAQEIAARLETFTRNEASSQEGLRQLLKSDRRAFRAAGIRALAKAAPSDASRYLVHLLTQEKMLTAGLLDEKACRLPDAVAAARAAMAAGTPIQQALEFVLGKILKEQACPEITARMLRILDLVAAISAPSCWNSFQTELRAYPDRVVRSKAVGLIGRGTKDAGWLGRCLLDRDTRVQANAAEALWELPAEEARPLLISASKLPNNRVAGNALLGLYRIADPNAIRELLDMTRHHNAAFQLTAYWAIGETQDPRFVPFLMEQFRATEGKVHLAVTRALARIRHRELALGQAGSVEIQVSEASIQADGRRRLLFDLRSRPVHDFSAAKRTEFALWEAGALIEDYAVEASCSLAPLAAGFVAPGVASTADPYADAVRDALGRCLAIKRAGDLWRIDRYSIGTAPPDDAAGNQAPDPPSDGAPVPPVLEAKSGFTAASELIGRAIASPDPSEKPAKDAFAAIGRQCEALGKQSGQRHLFAFLPENSGALAQAIGSLKEELEKGEIVLHGIALQEAPEWGAFRSLCQSTPEGTFTAAPADELPEAVEQMYAHLLNRFEITYGREEGAEAGPVLLKITTNHGAGRSELSLRAMEAPAAPPVPAAAALPVPAPA